MDSFEHAGIRYEFEPNTIGFASNGPSTAAGAIRRIRERGMSNLSVLDICCGLGVVGFTMLKELDAGLMSALSLADINVFNVRTAEHIAMQHELGKKATLCFYVSDGLTGLPEAGQFDLIVSNPPHRPGDLPRPLTPSWLGTVDEGYAFHAHFYDQCHRYLRRGGEIWFLENEDSPARILVPRFVADNPRLKLIRCEDEPSDPGFFWMLTRRVK